MLHVWDFLELALTRRDFPDTTKSTSEIFARMRLRSILRVVVAPLIISAAFDGSYRMQPMVKLLVGRLSITMMVSKGSQ